MLKNIICLHVQCVHNTESAKYFWYLTWNATSCQPNFCSCFHPNALDSMWNACKHIYLTAIDACKKQGKSRANRSCYESHSIRKYFKIENFKRINQQFHFICCSLQCTYSYGGVLQWVFTSLCTNYFPLWRRHTISHILS